MKLITSILALSAIIVTSFSVALPEPEMRITIDITDTDVPTDVAHDPFSMDNSHESVNHAIKKQTSTPPSQTVFDPKIADDNKSLPGSFTISVDSKFPLLIDTTEGDNYETTTKLLDTGSSDATVLTFSNGRLTNKDGLVAAWPYPLDRSLAPKKVVFRNLPESSTRDVLQFRAQNTTDGCFLMVINEDCPIVAVPGSKPGAELKIRLLSDPPAVDLKVIDV